MSLIFYVYLFGHYITFPQMIAKQKDSNKMKINLCDTLLAALVKL